MLRIVWLFAKQCLIDRSLQIQLVADRKAPQQVPYHNIDLWLGLVWFGLQKQNVKCKSYWSITCVTPMALILCFNIFYGSQQFFCVIKMRPFWVEGDWSDSHAQWKSLNHFQCLVNTHCVRSNNCNRFSPRNVTNWLIIRWALKMIIEKRFRYPNRQSGAYELHSNVTLNIAINLKKIIIINGQFSFKRVCSNVPMCVWKQSKVKCRSQAWFELYRQLLNPLNIS